MIHCHSETTERSAFPPKPTLSEAPLKSKEMIELCPFLSFSFAKHFRKAEPNRFHRQWGVTRRDGLTRASGAATAAPRELPGAPSPPFTPGAGAGPGASATSTTCPAVQLRHPVKKQAAPAAGPYQVTNTEVPGHHLFQKKNKSHHFNGTNFACETCIHTVLTV